jgi:hypothetical protein
MVKTLKRSHDLENRVLVKSYFEDYEKEEVAKKAAQLGMSVSEFVRRVAVGTRLPSLGNAETVRDLMKINSDLARLGNLFKMALDEEQLLAGLDLVDKIRETQDMLKEKIRSL